MGTEDFNFFNSTNDSGFLSLDSLFSSFSFKDSVLALWSAAKKTLPNDPSPILTIFS